LVASVVVLFGVVEDCVWGCCGCMFDVVVGEYDVGVFVIEF